MRTWFRLAAAVVGLAVIGSLLPDAPTEQRAAASPSPSPSPSAGANAVPSPESASDEPTSSRLGEPARDGQFEFVVSGIECGATKIGSQHFNTTAQGMFCVVELTITNVGDEPRSFSGENATLHNAADQEFSADSEAAFYLEDADPFYEEINPGNILRTQVVFDVPVGMTPTSIELHDSAFSGGVTVAVQ